MEIKVLGCTERDGHILFAAYERDHNLVEFIVYKSDIETVKGLIGKGYIDLNSAVIRNLTRVKWTNLPAVEKN